MSDPVTAGDGEAVAARPDEGAVSPSTGSLSRRFMLIAAGWISALLLLGGFALDRTLTGLVSQNFDDQLEYLLTAIVASAEVGTDGDENFVYFNRPLGDQRFLEPNSGLYWQITGEGAESLPSRSLWDRTLDDTGGHIDAEPHFYDSDQFPGEPLRVVERTIELPDSDVRWNFVVAGARQDVEAQIAQIRSILVASFAVLGLGLFLLAVMQTWYGLGPLRRIRAAIQRMRTAGTNRLTDPLPSEVQPLVQELNALLAHSERQAEEARTHAGNLAHALKTPLTVVTNAATADAPDLCKTVLREASVMRRQVDHHLARARAVGRRAVGAVANVYASASAVERAVSRLYPDGRFDIAGNRGAQVAIERQDLDEILGNLIENAAKYGAGSVFVTIDVDRDSELCEVWIEDDGTGIPETERQRIFARGARLDTGKPGTGLGLAIVRDVAEIYGGRVELAESEDLGGLLVRLSLPRAESEAETASRN
ncbi:sensor histidine kinase [Altererythrobacter sp. CAU 1778]